ncbi:MAG: hypothetical protein ACPGLV_03080 [Bacteroidia bacterium]
MKNDTNTHYTLLLALIAGLFSLTLSGCFSESCEAFSEPEVYGIPEYDISYAGLEGTEYKFFVRNAQEGTRNSWVLPNGETVKGDTLLIENFSEADSGRYTILKENDHCFENREFNIAFIDLSPDCVEERDVLYMLKEDSTVSTLKIVEKTIWGSGDENYEIRLKLESDQKILIDFTLRPTPKAYGFTGSPYSLGTGGVGMHFEFGFVTDFDVPKQEADVKFYVRQEGDHYVGSFCNVRTYNDFYSETRYMSAEFTFNL